MLLCTSNAADPFLGILDAIRNNMVKDEVVEVMGKEK